MTTSAATATPPSTLVRNSDNATVACAHCGTPVVHSAAPRDPAPDDAPEPVFCCQGCAIVYRAIAEHGLDRYYDLSENRAPAKPSGSRYQEYDDEVFHQHHVQVDAQGQAKTSFYLEDLRCAGCMWLVEATPRCLPGVGQITVDFARSRADIVFSPREVKLSDIAHHLDQLGHPVHPFRGLNRTEQRRREDRAMMVKLGVAGAAVGNLMLLAVALYAGMFGKMATRDTTFFRWASMMVAVPTLSFAASPFFRAAWGALRMGRLHLDLPLSLGIIMGLFWGSVNVIRGAGEVYFDSLAMLVFLLLVSRWLVTKQQRQAMMAGELLVALTPQRAHRVPAATADFDAAVPTDVPIEAISAGDILMIQPGEVLPVDGIIVHGTSAIDLGMLSGESEPKEHTVDATVHAGTTNIGSPLWVRATAIGESTRLGKLAAYVDELSRRKAPIEKMVDALAPRFVAVVMTLAIGTTLYWGLTHNWTLGIEYAMALLVVTCPCALALATPLAVSVAFARAAKQHILIKGADAIERLAQPGTLFLDKTGTITEGRSAVASWLGPVALRAEVAAIERASMHPVAKAIARHLDSADQPRPTATDIHEELGRGIAGTVGNRRLEIGSPTWILRGTNTQIGAELGNLEARLAEIRAQGASAVLVAVDGTISAIMGLVDSLRPETKHQVATLTKLGWRVELLSGDDPAAVARAGAAVGTHHSRGGATPEDKLAAVQASAAHGPTVFVGDGVNDAAALSAATCGIAVSGSAEASMEAADVYMSTPGIHGISTILIGATRTIATIKRNFKISLFYNSVAGLLAITGLIHPLIAALLMPVSSLTLLTSSFASRAFVKEPPP